jgi:hypothetical protein
MAEDILAREDSARIDRAEVAAHLVPALTALRLGVELLEDTGQRQIDRERLILLLRAAAAQAGQRAMPLLQRATGEPAS